MVTDPFERHGIDHLSPSSLRLWRDAPAVWIGKYLLKAPDESGPGAWRGRAVEAAVDRLLFNLGADAADKAMQAEWNACAQGVVDDDAVKEYDALPDFLTQAKIAFANFPTPLQRQARMSLTVPGISVPLVGFADWVWPDHGTDLKTTWRMPNGGKPDPNHVEQVSAYAMFHGVPFSLTYVTPKRWTRFEITTTDAAIAYDGVIEACHAIRSMLAHVSDGHDALSMFSPDYTSYYFRPAMTEAVKASKARRVIPSERNHEPLRAVEP